MNTETHTPTPWKSGRGLLDSKQVAIHAPGKHIDMAYVFGPQREQDADFVVRACNSHDKLVAALQKFIDTADMQKGGGDDMLRIQFDGPALSFARKTLSEL